MTTETTNTKNPFIRMAARMGLDESQAAGLMGVPVYTWRKWASGQRKASASAYRVLELLALMEAMAPDLLAALVPVATAKPARAGRKSKMEKEPL